MLYEKVGLVSIKCIEGLETYLYLINKIRLIFGDEKIWSKDPGRRFLATKCPVVTQNMPAIRCNQLAIDLCYDGRTNLLSSLYRVLSSRSRSI